MRGRPIRFVPEGGGVVEVTTRTLQGRFLIKPTPESRDRVLGVLGRALAMHPEVHLHAFVFLSNHYHWLLSVPDAKTLAAFTGYVNSNIARELGALHRWREKFWGRRYRDIPVLDGDAQLTRLRYLLAQGCKEGLVDRPEDWPGASSLPTLQSGRVLQGTWYDRTAEFRARRRGEDVGPEDHATRYVVPLVPLPVWAELEEEERRARTERMCREIEAETLEQHRLNKSRPMGVRQIRAQDPHDHPAALARSPAPLCHASEPKAILAFRRLYESFLVAYVEASARLRAGIREALQEFPPGCFPPASGFQPA